MGEGLGAGAVVRGGRDEVVEGERGAVCGEVQGERLGGAR